MQWTNLTLRTNPFDMVIGTIVPIIQVLSIVAGSAIITSFGRHFVSWRSAVTFGIVASIINQLAFRLLQDVPVLKNVMGPLLGGLAGYGASLAMGYPISIKVALLFTTIVGAIQLISHFFKLNPVEVSVHAVDNKKKETVIIYE